MKRYILLILTTLFVYLAVYADIHTSHRDTEIKRVLIIDSFQEEVSWSSSIAKKLESKLNECQAERLVNVEHLNADVAVVGGALNVLLRPILWSFAESPENRVKPLDYSFSTMFKTDIKPDVIVFIGDDGFLAYQNLEAELSDWVDIPLVLCGVKDSIIYSNWLPEESVCFEHIVPIEERRTRRVVIPEIRLDMLSTNPEPNHKGGQIVEMKYNITGVKTQSPIQKDLKLIHQLIPNLKELVWVDDEYYSSAYAKCQLKKEAAHLFPSVKISEITHNYWNTDSIYNEMIQPNKNKAYITYSWNISGLYSKKSDNSIADLFEKHSTVPLFSITERLESDHYWVGGYYNCQEELVKKTSAQIIRILNGEQANSIPFETISHGHYILNQQLLNKYKLSERAHLLSNITYTNIPPTLLEKYEIHILVCVLILTMLTCLTVYYYHIFAHNKQIKKKSNQYKLLYDYLQSIYESTHINFALFDKQGECIFSIIDGKEYTANNPPPNNCLTINLFASPYLDEQTKKQILEGEIINQEIFKEIETSEGTPRELAYQVIIKSLQSTAYQSARYIVICLDLAPIILNKKEKERYESLFQFASKFSHIGVAYYDINGTEHYITDSWYNNLNEPRTSPFAPTYANVSAKDREAILAYKRSIAEGTEIAPFCKDICVLDKQQREYWIQQHIFTRGKNNQYIIELNLNIDEQKQSEETLRKANQQAEQANVETERFIQNINHEIRTPLNSIIGFSEIIAYSNDKESNQFVSLIEENSHLLVTLVDNIIELSNIDSGAITFRKENFVMNDMIEEYTEYFHKNLYKKSLSLHYEISDRNAIISTDKAYLHQIIINILSNAIKFTEPGGSITLGYEQRENNHFFYVKDTGCGISKEEEKFIFKRFEKVNSFIPGTGLGLPLCQRIVHHLGGEIGVDSTPSNGSYFWWTIPV